MLITDLIRLDHSRQQTVHLLKLRCVLSITLDDLAQLDVAITLLCHDDIQVGQNCDLCHRGSSGSV